MGRKIACSKKINLIQRLPTELLSYIFQLCTQTDGRPELPVVLSHVCLAWARIVIRFLPCTYVKMSCTGPDPIHALCAAMLKRSQGQPITFELKAERHLTETEIRLFSRAAHRIRRLIMDPRSHMLTTFLWREIHFNLPALEEFEYRVNGDLRLSLSQSVGPSFRYYSLPLVSRYHETSWGSWRFDTVTCLTLKHMLPGVCPSLTDLARMLFSCSPRLLRFEFQGPCPLLTEDAAFWHELRHRLFFWKLESLEIGFSDNISPLAKLFAGGRAPHLKSLTLRNLPVCPESSKYRDYQHPSKTTTSNLFRLFVHPNRSSFANKFDFPVLEDLHLYGLDEDCDQTLMDEFLHGSSHLRRITLFAIWTRHVSARSPIYDCLFEYWDEFIPETPPAFPYLEEVVVSQGYYGLRRWLKRRMKAGFPPLKRLIITSSCYQSYSKVEDRLEDTLVHAAREVVVITDPSWCEYTFVEIDEERMLVKDGRLNENFSLIPRI
ncbi:hypothetical protein K435DRAFT_963304 [Dendrothele bispora CBS 962.96]|uniref:F-box domain-containing protein n=1 Tax=Dendrothele bispora (strain CBS 962.96) TaxID=1314807 RepID=A0A4S8MHG5_DENBC|nr:hypothetical protein K435DRAFT_963304 [Dendrothele bispora CBS 962.96]